MFVHMALIGVIAMQVQFTQDIPGTTWVKDMCWDFDNEDVARGFISANQAKTINLTTYLEASKKADFAKFKQEMLDEVRTLAQAKPAPKGPPAIKTTPDGRGLEMPEGTRITPGTSSEERERGTFSDGLRMLAIAQIGHSLGYEHTAIEHAKRRLGRVYSDVVTEYQDDPDRPGQQIITTERTMADGGMELIQRVGSDALSGGPTYGFTLKPTFDDTLFKIAREQEVFASAVRRKPISQGNELRWPALDQYKAPQTINGIPQAAVFGGITMSFKGEATPRVTSDAATNLIDFRAIDLTGATTFTRDYIVDNYINMEAEVTAQFGAAVGWIEDWCCIQGDGNAKPLGFMNSNCVVPVTRKSANKIASDDLGAMIASLSTQCWRSARFITNVTTFPQLFILQNAAGTPVFQPNALIAQDDMLSIMNGTAPSANLVNTPMGRLVGFPTYFTEKVPVLGSVGDLSLVCPDQYGLAERSGFEVVVTDKFLFSH